MRFDWDETKAAANLRKHGVDFADAVLVLEDDLALTLRDPRCRTAPLRDETMKREYDFSEAERGPVVPVAKGKTRITIRLDDDLLAWFKQQVHAAGGGNYQTLINSALRDYIEQRREPLEDTLRRVLREELRTA